MDNTDVLIVGGGLSGLYAAHLLHAAGVDFQLLEARDRFGGRIYSPAESGGVAYDLGPAWFWPHQPLINRLITEHGVATFSQYVEGDLLHEIAADNIMRRSMAMTGGYQRVAGGLGVLINLLRESLPSGQQLHLAHKVTGLNVDGDQLSAEIICDQQAQTIQCNHVIIAIPPRLAAVSIAFGDLLDKNAVSAMARIPTWMAGHAKLIATYDAPFWRDAGFNGEAVSQVGPLAEIHDASPADGSEGALFGFVGVPASQRRSPDALKAASLDQLARLFGSQARKTKAVLLQDWATEEFTSTASDHNPPPGHPAYQKPRALEHVHGGRLHFAAAEFGAMNGGLLEGALESSEAVAKAIIGVKSAI